MSDDGSQSDAGLQRLDAVLVSRGIARSRTHAAALVRDGLVRVDGVAVVKPSRTVAATASVVVDGDDGYVSRAAGKLIAALDAFDVRVAGRLALDAGASTGGFCQVLLERGAARVLALDVGHGQLAPALRDVPNLISREGVNVRDLTADSFLDERDGRPVELITADLSFISLGLVLAPLMAVASDDVDLVVLIKPQFEVGRGRSQAGVVRDPIARIEAVESVLWTAWDLGLTTAGLLPSPVVGSHGNQEYLAHLTRETGTDPQQWISALPGV